VAESERKTSKTGLAQHMREWMKKRNRPFTGRMICDGLGAETWAERLKIHNAVPDFLRRGEIVEHIPVHPPKRKRRQNVKRYKYNHSWRRVQKGKNKAKILKAMYVSSTEFAASDIERLSEAGRNHVSRIIKSLVIDGTVTIVGRRTCAAGVGAENLYNIPNRERFRVEVMG